ncbi:MAG TPA: hypothetical protein VEI58_08700, partial [Chthoniobacterales bacterium]|nr:hypothetical protein [Chthoniobacterales bacterium]
MSRRRKRKPSGSGSRARTTPVASLSGPVSPLRRPWISIAVCIFLALAVWAIYGQTVGFNFIYIDDDEYVFN